MNIEFVRRETTKKIMGFTALPTASASVTIAKGLEAIDFAGMIVETDSSIDVVTSVAKGTDEITITLGEATLVYVPSTGVISLDVEETSGTT